MIVRLTLWFLAISVVVGQMIRFPLPGQGGGVLVSDVAVVLTLLVTGVVRVRSYALSTHYPPRRARLAPMGGSLLFTPFIIWSLFTLVIHVGDYSTSELAIAGSYWVRTSCYLLLLPALTYLARTPDVHRTLHYSFVAASSALLGLGLVQIVFFPNLATLPPLVVALSGGGWDPHLGRAVSTWLDPNFFGAFTSIVWLYSLGCFFSSEKRHQKLFFLVLIIISSVVGILTQSRSSFIALAFTVSLLSPVILLRLVYRRTPALLPTVISLVSLSILVSILAAVALGDRLIGLFTVDPTVQLRLNSLAIVWRLAEEHSLVGVGYNAFQVAAEEAGLIGDYSIHSRSGADNSWLTLVVTTGIIGLFLFVVPWVTIAASLLRRWLTRGHIQALVAVASIVMLTIHSQFINSFLYPHLLIVLAVVVALAPWPRQERGFTGVATSSTHD